MLGWKKYKLESRLLGEISITSDMPLPFWLVRPHTEVSSVLNRGTQACLFGSGSDLAQSGMGWPDTG